MKLKEVKQKLKELGSSWDEFEKEYYNQHNRGDPTGFEHARWSAEWEGLILTAFCWNESKQGRSYWSRIASG